MKKLEKIGGVWLFLSIALFLASHFMWGTFSDDIVSSIYFISGANIMMVSGLILMLVCRTNIVHFLGTGMFCIFSWMISLEFLGDPTEWNNWNIATFVIDGVASIFISLKLKKYKQNVVG